MTEEISVSNEIGLREDMRNNPHTNLSPEAELRELVESLSLRVERLERALERTHYGELDVGGQ